MFKVFPSLEQGDRWTTERTRIMSRTKYDELFMNTLLTLNSIEETVGIRFIDSLHFNDIF